MLRARDKRLARLAARQTLAFAEAEERRALLGGRRAIIAWLREMLPRLDVDPARVTMLRVYERISADLAAAASVPTKSVVSSPSGAAGKIEDLAQRYRTHPEIDFAGASLASVFAWCIARGAAANPLQKQRE